MAVIESAAPAAPKNKAPKAPKKSFNLTAARMDWKRTLATSALLVLFLWVIVFLLITPNISTVLTVFWQDGAFTTTAFERVFGSPRAVAALRNSFILAPVLSLTVGFVGISLVLITDYFKGRGAKVLRAGYMTTLLYQGIILVSGYRFLYGQNGFLTNLLVRVFPNLAQDWFEGFWAVLFVMTFAATGTHLIFLRNALRSVDFQTIEAAKNMGASQFTILRKVVLPVLTPSMMAVTIFTFLGGLSAIAAPMLVGGRDFRTINPTILSFSAMPGSRDLAALMALMLGLATFVLINVLSWLERKGHYLSVSKVKSSLVKQEIKNPVVKVLVHVYAYVLFLIYAAPVVLIVLFSFTSSASIARGELSLSALSFENYIRVFGHANAYRPLLISLGYAFVASSIVAILMILVCRFIMKHQNRLGRFIEYAFMIPWLLPNVLIALGLITTFNQPQWFMGNQALTGTMAIMVIGYVIITIPFTLRMTKAAFFSVDDKLEEAAKNLGAKSFYAFMKVVLPTILPAVMAVFALNFNLLLAEFDMSIFLFHPLAMPLGVQIENLSMDGAGDSTAITFVYAVIMMIVSAIVLYVAYGRRGAKEER